MEANNLEEALFDGPYKGSAHCILLFKDIQSSMHDYFRKCLIVHDAQNILNQGKHLYTYHETDIYAAMP